MVFEGEKIGKYIRETEHVPRWFYIRKLSRVNFSRKIHNDQSR